MRFSRLLTVAYGLACFIGAPVHSIADIEPAPVTAASMQIHGTDEERFNLSLNSPLVSAGTPLWTSIDFVTPEWPRLLPTNWSVPPMSDALSDDLPAAFNWSTVYAPPLAPKAHTQKEDIAPFGLPTIRTPQGPLWTKWRRIEDDIAVAQPALARCRTNIRRCSVGAARFSSIAKQATARSGRDRIEWVNRRVNASVRYRSDEAQWHRRDVWSAPLDGSNRGSFNTGFGDCEDYAIAKYVALRDAGLGASDLRLLLVRDTSARIDHAVLAVRDGGQWLILDNRWSRLIAEADAPFFKPLFALDDTGVKHFTTDMAARQREPSAKSARETNASAGVANAHRTGKISG